MKGVAPRHVSPRSHPYHRLAQCAGLMATEGLVPKRSTSLSALLLTLVTREIGHATVDLPSYPLETRMLRPRRRAKLQFAILLSILVAATGALPLGPLSMSADSHRGPASQGELVNPEMDSPIPGPTIS